MTCNLFSGIFFTLSCHFNFLASLFVLSGYIPSSALNTVLLVVLEHPSILRGGEGVAGGGGVYPILMHGGSRMAIDPRTSTMPGGSTSGFHRPGRHCYIVFTKRDAPWGVRRIAWSEQGWGKLGGGALKCFISRGMFVCAFGLVWFGLAWLGLACLFVCICLVVHLSVSLVYFFVGLGGIEGEPPPIVCLVLVLRSRHSNPVRVRCKPPLL